MGKLSFFSASNTFITQELMLAKNRIQAESDHYMSERLNNNKDKTDFKHGVMSTIKNFIIRVKREKHYLIKNNEYDHNADKYNDSVITQGLYDLFAFAINTNATDIGFHLLSSATESYFKNERQQAAHMISNILPEQFELKDKKSEEHYSHMHPYLHSSN